MPTADHLRKLCLSLPDATEKLQWGENLCFKVRGKIFAIVDLSQGNLTPITLKSAPEQFHELLEIEGISQAPYVGRYKWILLENSNVLPAVRTRRPHLPVVRLGRRQSAKEESRAQEDANQAPQKVKQAPSVSAVIKGFLGALRVSAVASAVTPV